MDRFLYVFIQFASAFLKSSNINTVILEQIKHDTGIYTKRFLFKQMSQYTGLLEAYI